MPINRGACSECSEWHSDHDLRIRGIEGSARHRSPGHCNLLIIMIIIIVIITIQLLIYVFVHLHVYVTAQMRIIK
jgi:hypothetical protein